MDEQQQRDAVAWQTGVWDKMSAVYSADIDQRLVPLVEALIRRAALKEGASVLDLGTGTGAVARNAAQLVGPNGNVVATDISPEMLAVARRLTEPKGYDNVCFQEAGAESIPLESASVDVVLANLVMMYVIDRARAAAEIARVLKPGGRFVATVWAAADRCDIVRFQQTAGKFAPPPPVTGVGPGALADPSAFLKNLGDAGLQARVELDVMGFDFPDFAHAWNTLAGVTTAQLPPARQREAKDAVLASMYPDGDAPRHFRNETQFIVASRVV